MSDRLPGMPAALDLGYCIQSALAPASTAGALINQITLVTSIASAVIFSVVLLLVLRSVFSSAKRTHESAWIVGGGLIFPVVVLSALLVYALAIGNALSMSATCAAPIQVIGKRWWWDVRYMTPEGEAILANELHIPVGRPIELALTTEDVIHSFWVPSLAGKVDMIPGRVNRIVLDASTAGVYRGQCAEYCGGPHALMAFYVVVEPEDEYRAWLARQALPAAEPATPALLQGREQFMQGGCAACHAIRGTSAAGRLGPDLTHVGSRRSLAAGTLANHIGTLAGWIVDSQTVKPGNLMPNMNVFSGEELRALAAYLASLQ